MKKMVFATCEIVVFIWLLSAILVGLAVLSRDPISNGWALFTFGIVKVLTVPAVLSLFVNLIKKED